jgi:hypothetical protein
MFRGRTSYSERAKYILKYDSIIIVAFQAAQRCHIRAGILFIFVPPKQATGSSLLLDSEMANWKWALYTFEDNIQLRLKQ